MSDISSRYSALEVEQKWYKHWENNGYFHSEPDDREAFSIVIPPPNVTGVLHMGHMLNNTIQDVLCRNARLENKNVCWVPGTDHASIATEAKVVKMLREKGIKKSDLTRDEFLKYAWEWKEEYGGIILQQLKKLGASCDWERTAFTMDEVRSEAVIKAFVDLYNRGKLYRGLRMVNWDPQAQTVLSNEEVIYKEENSNLYHVKYQIVGSKEHVVIATTRPETILGDSAIAVHPDDDRYQNLKGAKAIVPIVNREIPIIFDDYVDREFGTGALKVTPAHDVNDYDIGKRHDLEVIDILNDDGSISEAGQFFVRKDRFEARKLAVELLKDQGLLLKTESHPHNVGRSERTNTVVEPKLSLQWYVDMPNIAKPALDAVIKDIIQFFPPKYKNTYRHWMENIRDWCISRQLWWGHRIPAWYLEDQVFVAQSVEEALGQAKAHFQNNNLKISDLKQDEDVLDTWFSSWLWPISVFDGFNDKATLDYYYPTSVLVTGWDIIFLWVARMVMAGYEWQQEKPFEHVYFTGMVRDPQGRKMSKSLGNSPDALKLIADYGADGVRYGMLSCSPAGGDLLFDEKLCDNGMKFCNKMWNALRLLKGWKIEESLKATPEQLLAIGWIESRIEEISQDTRNGIANYRLSEVLKQLYSFIWTDFCSWFLEMIKPEYQQPISKEVLDKAIDNFEKLMVLLHPFMPFVTEEIWQQLRPRSTGEDCMNQRYQPGKETNKILNEDISKVQSLITAIRELKVKNQLKPRFEFLVEAEKSPYVEELLARNGVEEMIKKLAFVTGVEVKSPNEISQVGASFLSGKDKFVGVFEIKIDIEEEKAKINKELNHARGFVMGIEKKLSNERFVNNAPEAVITRERQKLADGQERIRILEENLASL